MDTSQSTSPGISVRSSLAWLWGLLLGGFLVLPTWFLTAHQPGPWYRSHLVFHLVAIPLLAVAGWLASRVARSASPRSARVLAWVVVGAVTISGLGQLGELVAVLGDGGLHSGDELFEEPQHLVPATFAPTGWLLAILVLVPLSLTTAVSTHRRRRRERVLHSVPAV